MMLLSFALVVVAVWSLLYATQVNLGVSIVAIELKKYLREKGAYISYD